MDKGLASQGPFSIERCELAISVLAVKLTQFADFPVNDVVWDGLQTHPDDAGGFQAGNFDVDNINVACPMGFPGRGD
ncbi:MAG: hypothetical protein KDJ51_15495, partial [Nitratireductor sp.]|nr:hypothetical protein [Nitratireductor sp.]